MNRKLEGIIFFTILALAFWFRLVGLNWDEGHQLHPDERFLNMVEAQMKAPASITEYFDSSNSKFNPHNIGFSFFVYGTLPLFLIRVLSLLFAGWHDIPLHMFGRYLSVALDLGSVLFVYYIARALAGRTAALLAMFLSACSVLQIQHAHFGVFDSAITFFCTAAVGIAVAVVRVPDGHRGRVTAMISIFGCIVGCAMASKVNGALVGIVLAPAMLLRGRSARAFVLGGMISLIMVSITFRVFQPYAFVGPSFWQVSYNPKWIANMRELSGQGRPSLGFPPAVQWVNREWYFGLYNLLFWGLGLIPGIAILLSIFYISIKAYFGDLRQCLIPLIWVLCGGFVFGVLPYNPTMRYLLPIYPSLYVLFSVALIDICSKVVRLPKHNYLSAPIYFGASLVLISAVCWARGFVQIYIDRHPRILASEWIVSHIPGPVALHVQNSGGESLIQIPLNGNNANISFGAPLQKSFAVAERAHLTAIEIPKFKGSKDQQEVSMTVDVQVPDKSDCASNSRVLSRFGGGLVGGLGCILSPGEPYSLEINLTSQNTSASFGQLQIAHETTWDDGLPLRVKGYDPYGGLYTGKVNLEIYWPDNNQTIERFASVLGSADYLFMTSNRQWGSVGRLPKEYPTAQRLYRLLASCSSEITVPECYATTVEGEEEGVLGYKLVKTFSSYPRFLGYEINDQLAEEAFSVYDHPKVMIFKKVRDVDIGKTLTDK